MAKSARKRTRQSPPSITSKVDSRSLARAIKRRQATRTVSQLFDQALPADLLHTGLVSKHHDEQAARLSAREPHLSPFVLYVGEQTTQEEDKLSSSASADLLLMRDDSSEDDLVLQLEDLHTQLNEPTLLDRGWSLFSLPRLRKTPLSTEHTESIPVPPATTRVPENIFDYFDLPEETEEEDDLEEEAAYLLEELLEEEDENEEPEIEQPASSWGIPFSLPTPTLQLPLPPGWQKALGTLTLVSLAFILPLHAMNRASELGVIRANAESQGDLALSSLEAGAEAVLRADGPKAQSAFVKAHSTVQAARSTLDELGAGTSLLLSTMPGTGKTFRSARSLLRAGEAISTAGIHLSEGLTSIESGIDTSPTSRLNRFALHVEAALPHMQEAEEAISSIDTSVLNTSQARTFAELESQLPLLIRSMEDFLDLADMASIILGEDGSKRYLLVFQNNTELRPTGGFMGSFAEIKVSKGKILEMNIPGGGTYDLQGSLQDFLISPKPLQLLSARWEFQDANWFPDFPSSARQLIQFYRSAGGPSVDGVLAVNATYVADLLSLLGPIDMPEYERTIDADNFLLEAQKIVEVEYDREENKPKAFIGDLAPKLLDRALDQDPSDFLTLAEAVGNGLSEKSIQVYLADNTLQKQVLDRGWGGAMEWTDSDYLMVVNTNLGGGKTDAVMDEDVDVHVDVQKDGSVVNTVTITRTHFGAKDTLFSGVNNVNYLRLYVPKDSTLLSADGFTPPEDHLFDVPDSEWEIDEDLVYSLSTYQEDPLSGTDIYEELGKTVFGNWVQTKPGTTSRVQFKYRLPASISVLPEPPTFLEKITSWLGFSERTPYKLFVQKQSGVVDRTTTVHVTLPERATLLWSSHDPERTIFTNSVDHIFSLLLDANTSL